MKLKANWARVVAAIFTTTVFYASVCSTTCAVGVCPNQVQHTVGHDCDQMPSDHSDHSRHPSPDSPDCSQHGHPRLFLTKSGDLSQFQLSVVDHPNASAPAFSLVHRYVASFTGTEAPEHTPHFASSIALYQQFSVLRI